MASITAFADEFGNNSFDFDSQGTHFIIATVVANTNDLDSLNEEVSRIRKKHKFQTGEIKSSKVGKNYRRRLAVLEDIVKLNITIYSVVINKKELSGEGFGYKKSFYKFTNGLLYKELYRTYPNLDLYVDEHGGNDFMKEFKRYVEKNHMPTLFAGSGFSIMESKTSDLIQIADFVAGTLGYVYDSSKVSLYSGAFLEVLNPIISHIDHFPRRFTFSELQESNIDEKFDERIAEVSFLRVQDFLDKTNNDDSNKADQIVFLKLLLWLQRTNPKNRYVTTKEVLNHLNHNRINPINEEHFRSKVVGNLRDKGILIASSRKGYRIPTALVDLNKFLKHGNGIILPMLNRIKEVRNAIKLATKNELDLLDRPEYEELKRLID